MGGGGPYIQALPTPRSPSYKSGRGIGRYSNQIAGGTVVSLPAWGLRDTALGISRPKHQDAASNLAATLNLLGRHSARFGIGGILQRQKTELQLLLHMPPAGGVSVFVCV